MHTMPKSESNPYSSPIDRSVSVSNDDPAATASGLRIVCDDVGVRGRDGELLLEGISFGIEPGELVAIIGPSGAGKTTLLDVLAGLTRATTGRVTMRDRGDAVVDVRQGGVAYVPQDDIIHRELPLGRAIHYAARLRLPAGSTPTQVRAAAADALLAVGLEAYADRRVGDLSGGQRRRASIALELVTHPQVCLLDEPTSGLDAAAAASVVARLRALADAGSTVVFVSHRRSDLEHCDRVIRLAPGGRLAATTGPTRSTNRGGQHRAASADAPTTPSRPNRWTDRRSTARARAPRTATAAAQWLALTARSLESMARSRLTLAILLGSPAMVIAMFAILFRPGAFDAGSPSPTAIVMIVFWVAFGGFFFGLTYGLLQICPEVPIIRRERTRGISVGAQVLAKVAALAPALVAIDVVMLAVLRAFDRLPAADNATYARVAVTLALDAIAALGLGLLASAAVTTPAQASLALPMLCFPAVLFSGAIVPVPVMATVGRYISAAMTDRWAFEAIGRDLGVREAFASGTAPLGRPLLAEYGNTWTHSTGAIWLLLAIVTVAELVATVVVVHRRCRRSTRPVT